MGPQPGTEDNLPKDDGDASEDELPRIPVGAFVGGGDDFGSSDDDVHDNGDGRVEVGGYQLLDGGLAPAGNDDESEDESESENGDRDMNPNSDFNSGWARFDDSPNEEDLPPDSSHDPNWPSADLEGVVTDSVASLWPDAEREGMAPASMAAPASHPPVDSDFLAGGAHLLPANLRDVPPPRVASLSEGVRHVWAGRRSNQSGECSNRNMGKVDDIRKAMAQITLPETAVPEWANQLSEEDWRKALDERLNLAHKDI